LIMD